MYETGTDRAAPAAERENPNDMLRQRKEPRTLISRLYDRRQQLHQEIARVENSIAFLEKNAGLVEIVEVILRSQEKVDPY